MELGDATWQDVEESHGGRVLAVPLGSLEQHGPHLPLDTDTRIAVALCDGLADRVADVFVAPAVAYGASGEHAAFPGTLLISHEVLAGVLVELVRSARGSFRGVVFVNGHGGNFDALMAAMRELPDEDEVLGWGPSVTGGDAHAGRTETSLLLALCPEVVRLDRAEAGRIEPLADLIPQLRAEGVRPISSNGVLGDPAGASAAEGRLLLDELVSNLVVAVTDEWPELRSLR
jgi:creatinine amidohydrolase